MINRLYNKNKLHIFDLKTDIVEFDIFGLDKATNKRNKRQHTLC